MNSKRIDEAEAPAMGAGVEICAATSGQTKSEDYLMEQVVQRSNLWSAYQHVVRTRTPAVDDLTVTEDWLKVHWPRVKKALLEGRFLPQPVRRMDTLKPSGGVPTLAHSGCRRLLREQRRLQCAR